MVREEKYTSAFCFLILCLIPSISYSVSFVYLFCRVFQMLFQYLSFLCSFSFHLCSTFLALSMLFLLLIHSFFAPAFTLLFSFSITLLSFYCSPASARFVSSLYALFFFPSQMRTGHIIESLRWSLEDRGTFKKPNVKWRTLRRFGGGGGGGG